MSNKLKGLEIPIYFHNYKLLKDKEFVCEKQELTAEETGIQNSDGYERI